MSLFLAIVAGLTVFGAVLLACLRRMRQLDERDMPTAEQWAEWREGRAYLVTDGCIRIEPKESEGTP